MTKIIAAILIILFVFPAFPDCSFRLYSSQEDLTLSLRISPKAYVEEHLQSQWNVSSIRVKEQGGVRRHRYILSKRYILTSTILCNRGSNQPTLHSQWLSRNVNIVLVAAFAPLTRDRINPGKKCQSLIQVS